jgi:lysozyme
VAIEVGVGNNQPNPFRAAQVAGALAVGLDVRLYDFCFPLPPDGIHPNRDPVAQARLFLQEMQGLKLEGKPLILDFEWPKKQDLQKWGENADYVLEWTLACLVEVSTLTGLLPWVYTGPDYADAIGYENALELARYDLWIAHWGVTSPTVPRPWWTYSAWQYSNTGRVPGIQDDVDLSWFRTMS